MDKWTKLIKQNKYTNEKMIQTYNFGSSLTATATLRPWFLISGHSYGLTDKAKRQTSWQTTTITTTKQTKQNKHKHTNQIIPYL